MRDKPFALGEESSSFEGLASTSMLFSKSKYNDPTANINPPPSKLESVKYVLYGSTKPDYLHQIEILNLVGRQESKNAHQHARQDPCCDEDQIPHYELFAVESGPGRRKKIADGENLSLEVALDLIND